MKRVCCGVPLRESIGSSIGVRDSQESEAVCFFKVFCAGLAQYRILLGREQRGGDVAGNAGREVRDAIVASRAGFTLGAADR